MAQKTVDERLEQMEKLLEELAEDNSAVIGTLNQLAESSRALRAALTTEMDRLRDELAANLLHRALKDLCRETMPVLSAMERFVSEQEGSGDEAWRMHVTGIAAALKHSLSRFGVEKVQVKAGEDQFQMDRHACVKRIAAAESPFPDAPPRTVVRVVEDGYTIGGVVVQPARVEVQASAENGERTA
jgi:molecular chaperone GrpE (heat shock protein)